MRLLALNHFFAQDIQSLATSGYPGVEIRTIEYDQLRRLAMDILPPLATAGLGAMDDPRFLSEREEWASRLGSIINRAYDRWAFDALIAPSDLFFYVRDLPEVCHALGVTFGVVQKETTISPVTMEKDSRAIMKAAPPIADWMTCCSERNRSFWERCGWTGENITVTGQPRFDFYSQQERWPSRRNIAPTVLFFSYDLFAYHPTSIDSKPLGAWDDLHRQTEGALWDLARRGWKVQIKPHPQQSRDARWERIGEALRTLPRKSVEIIPSNADTRRLIVAADVVLGFQSTALIEAMTLGRPVIYTGWDPEANRLEDKLIPFPQWEGPVLVVRDSTALVRTVEGTRGTRMADADLQKAQGIIHESLGPVDGNASRRTLDSVAGFVRSFTTRGPNRPGPTRNGVTARSILRRHRLYERAYYFFRRRGEVQECRRLI